MFSWDKTKQSWGNWLPLTVLFINHLLLITECWIQFICCCSQRWPRAKVLGRPHRPRLLYSPSTARLPFLFTKGFNWPCCYQYLYSISFWFCNFIVCKYTIRKKSSWFSLQKNLLLINKASLFLTMKFNITNFNWLLTGIQSFRREI